MSSDGEGNDFHVLAEGDPSVRYNLANDGFVHECDDECKTYRQKEIDLIGDEAFNSEGYVDCEYTWGGPETSDSDVHVVMLWPAG
jgi:hypothetical protein